MRPVLILLGSSLLSSLAVAADEWPTYGHDSGGMRFSSLTQITPANVATLQQAWVYHMRPSGELPPAAAPEVSQRAAEGVGPQRRRSRFFSSEATPLVVNGVMYLGTPYGKVVALNPTNGGLLWSYELPNADQPAMRGLEYWPGDRKSAAEVVVGTRDGRLIALDARSGTPVDSFGEQGIVNLKTPQVMAGKPDANYGLTSPPLVYKDLVMTGARVQEFPEQGPAGDVRAWNVRTGRLVWTFHTVAQPGEVGHDTWQGDSWRARSGTNVWGFMTVDTARGIVYLPVAAPTWDRYGGDRIGSNLFGTSIVALNAKTGKYLWHFQTVHHDIWDFDTQAPPLLLDVQQGGHRIPAVAIVSKTGYLYLLNRVNGKPIYPIVERAVPASDAPGEQAWPTQPVPVKPEPFARVSFSMADVATITPELESYCRNWIESNHMRSGGPFLPLGYNVLTINFPGRQGGANWGGGSFNPQLGYFFVNASNLGQVEQLAAGADGKLSTRGEQSGRFSQRDTKLMCQQPPWGTLTAINVNTGQIAWQSTLGVSDNLPEQVAHTGRPNIGGSIATASGLIFIGAADDGRFRAFDAQNGHELWTVKLDAAAHATPITYLGPDGKQYVVVTATGGSFLDSPISGDSVVAFALPN
jgi:quinoprotein glucose dehydrogenase